MKKYFAFVLPFGTYTYNRLVMGFIERRSRDHTCMGAASRDITQRCTRLPYQLLLDDLAEFEGSRFDKPDLEPGPRICNSATSRRNSRVRRPAEMWGS